MRSGKSKSKANSGKIVIISSPSGGGKTSICRKLLSPTRRKQGWTFSVSYTTRRPRTGERNGREYFFIENEEFQRLERKRFFAESFQVHQYRYGTPRGPIENVLNRGGVMLFDVDVQGARKLHKEYKEAISIFVLPPSVAALRRRLKLRGTETAKELSVRFDTARREMANFQQYGFDYVVVNDDLNKAVRQVLAIVEADPCRIEKINKEHLLKITR
jgi:guanylate kinase